MEALHQTPVCIQSDIVYPQNSYTDTVHFAEQMNGFYRVEGSLLVPQIANATSNCTYAAAGGSSTNNFDAFDYIGIRGALGGAVAQYSVMTFSLGPQSIANAALWLRGYSVANPSAWDATHKQRTNPNCCYVFK